MHYSSKVLIFCLFVLFPLLMSGQGTGNSPFSQFGIGDLTNNNGNIRNMGMGYAGVSARNHYFVNQLNPALLCNMRTRKKARPNHHYKYYEYYRNMYIDSTVKLDFGLNFEARGIQAANGSEFTRGINVAYLAFALPLSKTWSTSVGITPISTVNYDLYFYQNVNGTNATATNSYSGRGGLYKIFWGHGVSITENLSVGLESALIYGNINQQTTSTVPDSIANFGSNQYGFKRQSFYTSFDFKPGMNFRREIVKIYHDTIYEQDSLGEKTKRVLIRKTKSSGMFYNIGFAVDCFTQLNVHRNLDLYTVSNSNIVVLDTTIQSTYYKTKMPPNFRLGFSIDQPLRWTIAADVFYGAWSVYNPSFIYDPNVRMGNSYGFTIGGEITPGQLKLRSKTYRAGFSYMQTPIVYNGNKLDDISASFGGTIPFGRRSGFFSVLPRINFAIIVGQRGNINLFALKEQYIKASLGITINEKWFTKRKIY
jgi:hypothetical protein